MARINVKALVALVVLSVLLAVGGAVALRLRRQGIAERALAAGQAAINAGDWASACEQLKIYLAKRPDDYEALEQFAKANLEVRPRSVRHTMWAIKAYRRLLRQRPGDDAICEALAGLYVEVRDFSEAAYVCRQRLEADPSDADAALALGTVLVAQRKFQEAEEVLEALTRRNPDQIQAYALLSNVALQDGTASGKERALKWLDQAVTENPDSAEAGVLRARYFRVVRHDRNAAASELEDAESRRLTDPNVRLALAEEWLMLGQYDRADAHGKALGELDEEALKAHDIYPPDMTLALFSLNGLSALRQGDKQRAGDLAAGGLAALPEGRRRTAFLPLAAELFIAAGDLDRARRCLADYREEIEAVSPSSTTFKDDLVFLESLAESAAGNDYQAINRLEKLLASSPKHMRARKLLAASFVSTQQWRRAAREYKEYLQSAPDDAAAILQYAEVCRKARDLNEFLLAARSAERLMPDSLQAKKLRIEAEITHIERGGRSAARLEALAAELADLQASQDRRSEFEVLRARLAALQGRSDEAIQILKSATEAAPDALQPMLELVARYARNGSTEQAIAACRETCRRHPAMAEPRIILAKLLVGDERYEEAAAELNAAVSELGDQDKLKVQVFLAQLKIQHGDRPAGVSLLRRLAVEHGGNAELRRVLLMLPEVRGDRSEAQRLVDELRAIEGERGIRWPVEQAKLWLQSEEWEDKAEDVEAMLRRCIAADPRWRTPALLLGGMFERLGRDADAEEIYVKAIDNDPGAGDVAERLVALLTRRERFADAEALLQRIRADSPGLRNQRVASAMRRGQYGIAIDELRRRVAEDARDAQSRVRLAQIVYGTLRDAGQALALLDEAQAIAPDMLEAVTTRARIVHLERGPDEAEKILSDEVERRGDFAAYLSRARYYAETGRLDEADRDYTHLTSFPESSAAGFRTLGMFRQSHGRRQEAIEAWEEGLREHPGDVEIQRLLIKALAASGDPNDRKRGEEMLGALLEVRPDDADLLYVQAAMLLSDGTDSASERARGILERVVSLAPHHAAAYLKLISLARRRGDSEAADELLTRAFSANPEEFAVDLAHAELQLERGNLGVAREIAARAGEKEPSRAAPRVILAMIALRIGDSDQARSLVDEALRLEPENERAQLLRSHLLYLSGDRDQAIQSLEEFRGSTGGRGLVAPLLALAEMYRLNGDMTSAARYLDEATRLEPDRTDVFLEKLAGLAASKHFDDIVREVDLRRTEHPREYSVLMVAGSLLEAAGDPAIKGEAERWYAAVPVEEDEYGRAQLALARIAFRRGGFGDAVAAYRRVIEKEPDQYQALNDLAWILGMQLGELEEAIVLADRGLSGHPNDPHLLDTRGALLVRAGRLTEAQRDLERCLIAAAEIPATRASALLHLARMHLKRGEPDPARRRLEEAASIDENFHVYGQEQRAEASRLLAEAMALMDGSDGGG